ncbi:DNA ligase [Bradyrhizobium erythrophlei]|uniref:ATP dependent DNA ligase domain-containing protein n=1 Tax=Bradyrhizobium erythrophlei TaxID=1437360 RepID=A0A1M5PUB6_9BRAD|nr:DNA ligase [Bradyrhizobium erythrophlei]SHH05220.1 ATP dependent DNA ligase domain-containing protein [Bradyrhizobium erythrophlei]
MTKHIEFCIPTVKKAVPAGPDWIHEVKYDGYRLRLERDGSKVRLLSKGGNDLTKRYPWIVETALKIRKSQFIIDGEAVVLGVDGISDFNALHSRKHDHEVQLYSFDLLAYNGDDLRGLPLHLRKTNLEQLLRGRPDGIFVAPFEQGEIGPELFEAACRMGLEGLVSKRRERLYRPRTCDWVKVKNRSHPAYSRVLDQF